MNISDQTLRSRIGNVDRTAHDIAHRDHLSRRARAKSSHVRIGWDRLTTIEVKVAKLVQEGRFNWQIADILMPSRQAIATHISRIPKRLDALLWADGNSLKTASRRSEAPMQVAEQ